MIATQPNIYGSKGSDGAAVGMVPHSITKSQAAAGVFTAIVKLLDKRRGGEHFNLNISLTVGQLERFAKGLNEGEKTNKRFDFLWIDEWVLMCKDTDLAAKTFTSTCCRLTRASTFHLC